MTKSRALVAGGLSAVLATVGLVAGIGGSAEAAGTTGGAGTVRTEVTSTLVDVKARDGVVLKGTLSVPKGTAPAGGWPAVVMPGTFGGNAVDASGFGPIMAQRGYVTYTYYERGFAGSGGTVEGGGVQDVTDVSDVITWMIANTPLNKDKIGLVGLSYGAGIGLMAGWTEPRLKAISAMSGWADMTASFYPNQTPNQLSLQGLFLDASVFGKPSAQITSAFTKINEGDYTEGLEFAKTRGAQYYKDTIGGLTKTPPPLQVSEPFNEVVFPIQSTMKYWTEYSGIKRLELRAGDHGDPEWGTGFNLETESWTNAMRWMDAYVGGYDKSIATEPPVYVVPRSSNGPKAALKGTSVADVTGAPKRFYLSGQPRLVGNDAGTLTTKAGSRSTTIKEGQEWLVRNGVPILSYGVESVTGIPPTIFMAGVNPDVTAIFKGPLQTSDLKLRGEVKVHLTLTPTAKDGTVVVHVVDNDAIGFNFAVAHEPYTWHDKTPGKPFTVDFTLPYNAYDFTFGHRLQATVSTSDTTYIVANPANSKVTIGPDSYIDVPVK